MTRAAVAVGSWALVFTVISIAMLGVLDGSYGSVFLLMLALVSPLLVYACIQTLRWQEPYVSAACAILLFLFCAVFRIRGIDEKSIDFQIVIKLVCIGAMASIAAVGLLGRPWHPKVVASPWQLLGIVIFYVFECFNSVNTAMAITEALTNLVAFALLVSVFERLGGCRLIRVLVQVGVLLCLASLVVYACDPELGRMVDWVDNAYVQSDRLQGVFGTPNGAGASSGFCLLVIILLEKDFWIRPLAKLESALFVTVMLASNNRMAVLVVVGLLFLFYLRRHAKRLALPICIVFLALLILTLVQAGGDAFSFLSRTGSLDEIVSGNGRMQIWSVVLDLWELRPLLGYGVGSAKFILPHHPLLFGAAAHAHSLYLTVLFGGGIVGFGIFTKMIWCAVRNAQSAKSDSLLVLISFFLLYGITEPLIGGLPSFVSIGFFATMILCDSEPERRGDRSVQEIVET